MREGTFQIIALLLNILALVRCNDGNTPTNSHPLVYQLNPQNFNQIVMTSTNPWIISFYTHQKEWCQKCDEVQYYIEQLATNLNQLGSKVQIGKFNMDQDKSYGRRFNVNGWRLPGIMYFPTGEKSDDFVTEYREGDQHNPDQYLKWVLNQIKMQQESQVVELTTQNFNEIVMKSQQQWLINFYTLDKNWCSNCDLLRPQWIQASILMKDQIKVGSFNCDKNKEICKKFRSWNFPAIRYLPLGDQTNIQNTFSTYPQNGAVEAKTITEWALEWKYKDEIRGVAYLDSEQTFKKFCEQYNGACFIGLFPQQDKVNNYDFQRHKALMDRMSLNFASTATSFLYFFEGEQPAIEQTWNPCQKRGSYPCVLGINFKKDMQRGWQQHVSDYNQSEVTKFIEELNIGRRAFIPIRGKLPQIFDPNFPEEYVEEQKPQTDDDDL